MSPARSSLAPITSADAVSALADVWGEHRAAVVERLDAIEQVVVAMEEGALDERVRIRAQREAHKLAGSLGTFGFMTGTERAREIELLLGEVDALRTASPAILAHLVAELRADLVEGPAAGLPAVPTASRPDAPLLDIVDDDAEVAGQIAAEGRRRGMRVRVHTSPAAARAALDEAHPAVVLLDLTFPEGVNQSYELLSELKELSPAVPVLVFTVREGFVDRVEVARRGGQGFLPKSLRPSQVIDAASEILDRERNNENRVMVVDDDAAMLAAVRATLEPQGISVTTLVEPMAFWEVLEEVSPDMLILDVDMPDVNGIELCRVVRNDARWFTLPILFLTGHTDADTVDRLFAEGADDYLSKPIVGSELRVRIVNRLERLQVYRRLADTDGLTGVRNRRNSSDALDQLARMAARHGQPLCLAELDLDQFKRINDRYGHAAGDAVLARLGKLLLESFRGEDVVGRWGGEEFVVGMYGLARTDGARRVADLLQLMREQEFDSDGETYSLTFSAGVAEYPTDGSDLHELYRAADTALYAAKQAGRDRVVEAISTSAASPGGEQEHRRSPV